ncbi:hypothetical protein [Maribacter sp. 2304DJ31-5]|uniref:hypothetical protein n=1 Tax=Maribacter sp. 2304DJ31-5 TaxID=3386273 RepID=UPI0039BD01B2
MDTYCKKLLLPVIAIFLGHMIVAQEKVFKQLTESYPMTDSGELHLENKYGDINIYGWDKEEISISIAISVTHKKKANAEDLIKRIDPKITGSDNFVDIAFKIAEKNDNFFTKYFNKANPFDPDRNNVEIDYTVYMPIRAQLKITNKFGDVIIEDWEGRLRANVEHGDIWINKDLSRADIDVNYGKLRGQSIDYGTVRLKNGSLNMVDSKNLRINSNGSYVTINSAASLEIYSNKDEVILEEVGTLYGTLKFSTMELNRLKKDIDLSMKVTDFRVSKILDPNTDIAIQQESSKVSLNIANIPLRLKATLEQGLVRLPKSFKNVESNMINEGKRIREITAVYGNNSTGKVSITGKKGVILLKELY